MLKDFKQFLLRGNVVDLAVGVVIGAAFGSVVAALVSDFITPLISAVSGAPNFNVLYFTINGSIFAYGHFLNTLISFLLIALVVFFLVIKPINFLINRSKKELSSDPAVKKCAECLSEIPASARRCSHCTQLLQN